MPAFIVEPKRILNALLGRGGCNRSRENPGIAKKGGGGGVSDPCQDFFGGFVTVNRG